MHIDSLTITALLVFIIMLAVFVRFCKVKVCGMAGMQWRGPEDGKDSQDKAEDGS
jgi:hypothetical protein